MAELADAPDLGSGETFRAGSSPVTRTKQQEIGAAYLLLLIVLTYGAEPR